MGLTVLTALTIKGNYPDDIEVSTGGKDSAYAGFIYLMRDGEIRRPLISTQAVFETKEAAETAMNDVIKDCLDFKL